MTAGDVFAWANPSGANREPPFSFRKPTDAMRFVPPGTTSDHPYPTSTKNDHYELEFVVALATGGKSVPVGQALEHVYGHSPGLDMTRRDMQRAMGDEKKRWEIGKSFDHSAVIGQIHPVAQTGHFLDGGIWLKVNGTTKQDAPLRHMIWSAAEQFSMRSQARELFPGDFIYGGTPDTVGPVVRGDVIEVHIDRLPDLSVRIA